ncbi:MAG: trehalase [Acidobacteria bacterium]|nr:trehalase [Acidobacteriota bacterium]
MPRFLVSLVLVLAVAAQAQTKDITTYIHHTWDTLTRSTTQCNAVSDSKVAEKPIVYLPAGMAIPADLAKMQKQCGVEVEHLPRRITHIAEVMPDELPRTGVLYLPHPYVVPGGRFNEMYGWDSYFIILGLLHDGRDDLARGMAENFFFEIENYGALLNANRTYYLTRSQPPLLAEIIRELMASKNPPDRAWLEHAYTTATKDYALWKSPEHRAGNTGLARYKDFGSGPVPEMADDDNYYRDVIRWMQEHRRAAMEYLVHSDPHPDAAEKSRLRKISCDVDKSSVCARATLAGSRLTKAFFDGDRAMRESGFDTSFRFGPFSGSTQQYAPVCLNSLLYRYEMDMSDFAQTLGKTNEAAEWMHRAERRKSAMQLYLWNARRKRFVDYNFVTHKQSDYHYVTEFYPLWAGWTSPEQAKATMLNLGDYERKGGLAMSLHRSGMQWDEPFGWAPTNYFAIAGMRRYGFNTEANRIAKKFMHTIESNYAREDTIREKYNVEAGTSEVQVTAGYKANVAGFGWTNGVYLRLKSWLAQGDSLKTQDKP